MFSVIIITKHLEWQSVYEDWTFKLRMKNTQTQIQKNSMPSVFIFFKHLKWILKYDDLTLKVANLCDKLNHITYHMQMLQVIRIDRNEYSSCFCYNTVLFNFSPQNTQPGSSWVNLYFLWNFCSAINTTIQEEQEV